MNLQVLDAKSAEAQSILRSGSRPKITERKNPVTNEVEYDVQIVTSRGLTVNSALRKYEWEELDTAIVAAATAPLNMTQRFINAGLVRPLGGLGTLIAQYNKVSETSGANVSLSGTGSGQKDLVDFDIAGVPVPVIFKEFEINERYLQSSRLLGNGIDVTNAQAAARVVGEKIEDMLINGDSNINLNGSTIYGITSHPNRNTGSATGDWGTISNIVSTVASMTTAAKADNYRGPYGLFVADTQYDQAAQSFYTDGSGQSGLDRILRLPNISFVDSSAWLDDGEAVLVNLSRDVVELAYIPNYFPATNLEWMSGDGMATMFKVMAVFAPIVKADYAGRSGIVHITGC